MLPCWTRMPVILLMWRLFFLGNDLEMLTVKGKHTIGIGLSFLLNSEDVVDINCTKLTESGL